MAPKRSQSHVTDANPAKRSARKLPSILSEALAVLPQSEYIELLNAHVLPDIDDRSFRSVFELAIQRFKAKDEIDQLISFKKNQQQLDQSAKDLKFSLKHNWKDGYQEQSDLMCSIVSDIERWINKLFLVACERGLELDMVQKCLILMEKHLLAIKDAHMRIDYDARDWDLMVCSSKDEVIYYGQPDCVICLFWRDVLLTAVLQDEPAVLSKYRAYNDGDLTDVLTHIPGEAAQEHSEETDCELCDEWHSNDMKAAIPRLLKFLQTTCDTL